MMVLRWLFVGYTGKETSCSLLRSPERPSFLSFYDSFTWKMVLKRHFFSDTGRHIHYYGLPGGRTH